MKKLNTYLILGIVCFVIAVGLTYANLTLCRIADATHVDQPVAFHGGHDAILIRGHRGLDGAAHHYPHE